MNSTIERKCSNCGQWNAAEDYCKYCKSPISIKVLEQLEIKEKKRLEAKRPDDKIDILIKKFRHHPFIPFRIVFYVLYSVWLIFMGIGSFVAWLIAWTAG